MGYYTPWLKVEICGLLGCYAALSGGCADVSGQIIGPIFKDQEVF